jgi:hypothetical protein
MRIPQIKIQRISVKHFLKWKLRTDMHDLHIALSVCALCENNAL